MKRSRWKTAVAGLVTALVLTALPFTISATNAQGELGLEFGSNVACADGTACCAQFGSVCSGRLNKTPCWP